MWLHLHTTNLSPPYAPGQAIHNDKKLGGLLLGGTIARDNILPNIRSGFSTVTARGLGHLHVGLTHVAVAASTPAVLQRISFPNITPVLLPGSDSLTC